MEKFDVIVVGGGIAGSVSARFAAKNGFKTLLVEKEKTPRNKPCSGIQFTYFEKLVGKNIPREKLCKNELYKVEMNMPDDRKIKGKMKMLNFWRSTFDSWLNRISEEEGAEFQDRTSVTDFRRDDDSITLKLSNVKRISEVRTRYLIAADGSMSRLRWKIRPHDFQPKQSGAAINYYFVGDSTLDRNTLYMIYNRDYAPLMFAWVYLKDKYWVIGTGSDDRPVEYADRFFSYVKKNYNLKGEIVKKEGYVSSLIGGVYLGETNLLMVGDAAGLVDMYRGLGMDNAAISGRLAIKAIIKAEELNRPAIEPYNNFMGNHAHRLNINQKKQEIRYASNEHLQKSLSTLNMLKGGITMMVANQLNKVLPPEKVILLPR